MFLFSKELKLLWNADRRPGRAYSGRISAKLFCKHSQVTFIPYGVVSKDERRTSNIELKKQTSNTKHSTTPRRGFFSAVLILVTKILINSSVSCKISSNSSGFLINGTRWISFNHLWVSLSPIQRSMFDVHLPQSVLGKKT